MYGILLQRVFSLLQQLCTVDNGIFLYGWCERHFVPDLKMNILPDKYFKTVFEWLSFTWQFASITT